ncbi:MAG: hypothetical protein SVR94_12740 [Pseudomonadota bacterium]|nr:hypothetical protein [Pseudomonadota bacterium]
MRKFRLYPKPNQVDIRYWMTFYFTITVIILGVIIALTIRMLPLIPSWQATKLPAISIVAITLVVTIGWHITVIWRIDSSSQKRRFIMVFDIISAILGVAVIGLILTDIIGSNLLHGEEIVTSVREHKSGDEIFIYHLSEIPDGFIAAQVTVRCSALSRFN